ncbi:MAG TPA: CPBP family intramembrane glutamic endopeptidase [Anaerolineales bacterium]|nr:CPBP family intramembrane glutamic endopeptidase [Anaerolineales bacterium]
MSSFSLPEFLVILALGLLGAAAILPYSFALAGDKLSRAKLSLPLLALISFLQTALLIAMAASLGMLAAQAVGLGAPNIQAALRGGPVWTPLLRILPPAIALAVLAFAPIALLERLVFAAHVPAALGRSDACMPVWKRLLASLYGGLDEEILMRLFLVSGLVWILGRFWQNSGGLPAAGAYWAAIILAAVLFGLGHLPATGNITPLTPMLVLRAVALNGVAGIAFGWLYWQYGLEAAMLSHFCADLLLHVLGPVFGGRIYGNGRSAEAPPDSK